MVDTPAAFGPGQEIDLDDWEESLGLDEDAPRGILATSLTSEPTDEVIVYPHGYSLRVRLLRPHDEVVEPLGRIGWTSGESGSTWRTWSRSGGGARSVLRGSAWLTARAPRNGRLAIHMFNRLNRTKLYSLAVEVSADEVVCLDLQGVRTADVDRLLLRVMGLDPADFAVQHYRAAERYVVLLPHEADRLARELGECGCRGRGRLAGKTWLVRDRPLHLEIRSRTPVEAKLNLYRIPKGATAAYRCEVSLRGRSDRHRTFGVGDIGRLDQVLLELVMRHDLHPVPKPARWEPRSGRTTVECGLFDGAIRRLPQAAWRGQRIQVNQISSVTKLHTPGILGVVGYRLDEGIPAPARGIRIDSPESGSSEPGGVLVDSEGNDRGDGGESAGEPTLNDPPVSSPRNTGPTSLEDDPDAPEGCAHPAYASSSPAPVPYTRVGGEIPGPCVYRRILTPPSSSNPTRTHTRPDDPPDAPPTDPPAAPPVPAHPRSGWSLIASEVSRLPGFLSEVILDPDQDPAPLLAALSRAFPGLGVAALCHVPPGLDARADTFHSVLRAIRRHPPDDALDLLVLVVDPSVLYAVTDAVSSWDPDLGRCVPGPLLPASWPWDRTPIHVTSVGALLSPMLRGLRSLCEETGFRVLVITSDATPARAVGSLTRGDYFHDNRVRSIIGDAGRHWCHVRYRVESTVGSRVRRVFTWKDEAEGLTGRILD